MRKTVGTLLMSLFIMLVSSDAHAFIIAASGVSCHTPTGGNNYISYGVESASVVNNGAYNPNASSNSNFYCPLNVGYSTSYSFPVGELAVRLKDRSMTQAFFCEWHQVDWANNHTVTSRKWACSSIAGGCPSTDIRTTETGFYYITWSGAELGSLTSIAVDSGVYLYCQVPKKEGGTGDNSGELTSSVVSYFVQ